MESRQRNTAAGKNTTDLENCQNISSTRSDSGVSLNSGKSPGRTRRIGEISSPAFPVALDTVSMEPQFHGNTGNGSTAKNCSKSKLNPKNRMNRRLIGGCSNICVDIKGRVNMRKRIVRPNSDNEKPNVCKRKKLQISSGSDTDFACAEEKSCEVEDWNRNNGAHLSALNTDKDSTEQSCGVKRTRGLNKSKNVKTATPLNASQESIGEEIREVNRKKNIQVKGGKKSHGFRENVGRGKVNKIKDISEMSVTVERHRKSSEDSRNCAEWQGNCIVINSDEEIEEGNTNEEKIKNCAERLEDGLILMETNKESSKVNRKKRPSIKIRKKSRKRSRLTVSKRKRPQKLKLQKNVHSLNRINDSNYELESDFENNTQCTEHNFENGASCQNAVSCRNGEEKVSKLLEQRNGKKLSGSKMISLTVDLNKLPDVALRDNFNCGDNSINNTVNKNNNALECTKKSPAKKQCKFAPKKNVKSCNRIQFESEKEESNIANLKSVEKPENNTGSSRTANKGAAKIMRLQIELCDLGTSKKTLEEVLKKEAVKTQFLVNGGPVRRRIDSELIDSEDECVDLESEQKNKKLEENIDLDLKNDLLRERKVVRFMESGQKHSGSSSKEDENLDLNSEQEKYTDLDLKRRNISKFTERETQDIDLHLETDKISDLESDEERDSELKRERNYLELKQKKAFTSVEENIDSETETVRLEADKSSSKSPKRQENSINNLGTKTLAMKNLNPNSDKNAKLSKKRRKLFCPFLLKKRKKSSKKPKKGNLNALNKLGNDPQKLNFISKLRLCPKFLDGVKNIDRSSDKPGDKSRKCNELPPEMNKDIYIEICEDAQNFTKKPGGDFIVIEDDSGEELSENDQICEKGTKDEQMSRKNTQIFAEEIEEAFDTFSEGNNKHEVKFREKMPAQAKPNHTEAKGNKSEPRKEQVETSNSSKTGGRSSKKAGKIVAHTRKKCNKKEIQFNSDCLGDRAFKSFLASLSSVKKSPTVTGYTTCNTLQNCKRQINSNNETKTSVIDKTDDIVCRSFPDLQQTNNISPLKSLSDIDLVEKYSAAFRCDFNAKVCLDKLPEKVFTQQILGADAETRLGRGDFAPGAHRTSSTKVVDFAINSRHSFTGNAAQFGRKIHRDYRYDWIKMRPCRYRKLKYKFNPSQTLFRLTSRNRIFCKTQLAVGFLEKYQPTLRSKSESSFDLEKSGPLLNSTISPSGLRLDPEKIFETSCLSHFEKTPGDSNLQSENSPSKSAKRNLSAIIPKLGVNVHSLNCSNAEFLNERNFEKSLPEDASCIFSPENSFKKTQGTSPSVLLINSPKNEANKVNTSSKSATKVRTVKNLNEKLPVAENLSDNQAPFQISGEKSSFDNSKVVANKTKRVSGSKKIREELGTGNLIKKESLREADDSSKVETNKIKAKFNSASSNKITVDNSVIDNSNRQLEKSPTGSSSSDSTKADSTKNFRFLIPKTKENLLEELSTTDITYTDEQSFEKSGEESSSSSSSPKGKRRVKKLCLLIPKTEEKLIKKLSATSLISDNYQNTEEFLKDNCFDDSSETNTNKRMKKRRLFIPEEEGNQKISDAELRKDEEQELEEFLHEDSFRTSLLKTEINKFKKLKNLRIIIPKVEDNMFQGKTSRIVTFKNDDQKSEESSEKVRIEPDKRNRTNLDEVPDENSLNIEESSTVVARTSSVVEDLESKVEDLESTAENLNDSAINKKIGVTKGRKKRRRCIFTKSISKSKQALKNRAVLETNTKKNSSDSLQENQAERSSNQDLLRDLSQAVEESVNEDMNTYLSEDKMMDLIESQLREMHETPLPDESKNLDLSEGCENLSGGQKVYLNEEEKEGRLSESKKESLENNEKASRGNCRNRNKTESKKIGSNKGKRKNSLEGKNRDSSEDKKGLNQEKKRDSFEVNIRDSREDKKDLSKCRRDSTEGRKNRSNEDKKAKDRRDSFENRVKDSSKDKTDKRRDKNETKKEALSEEKVCKDRKDSVGTRNSHEVKDSSENKTVFSKGRRNSVEDERHLSKSKKKDLIEIRKKASGEEKGNSIKGRRDSVEDSRDLHKVKDSSEIKAVLGKNRRNSVEDKTDSSKSKKKDSVEIKKKTSGENQEDLVKRGRNSAGDRGDLSKKRDSVEIKKKAAGENQEELIECGRNSTEDRRDLSKGKKDSTEIKKSDSSKDSTSLRQGRKRNSTESKKREDLIHNKKEDMGNLSKNIKKYATESKKSSVSAEVSGLKKEQEFSQPPLASSYKILPNLDLTPKPTSLKQDEKQQRPSGKNQSLELKTVENSLKTETILEEIAVKGSSVNEDQQRRPTEASLAAEKNDESLLNEDKQNLKLKTVSSKQAAKKGSSVGKFCLLKQKHVFKFPGKGPVKRPPTRPGRRMKLNRPTAEFKVPENVVSSSEFKIPHDVANIKSPKKESVASNMGMKYPAVKLETDFDTISLYAETLTSICDTDSLSPDLNAEEVDDEKLFCDKTMHIDQWLDSSLASGTIINSKEICSSQICLSSQYSSVTESATEIFGANTEHLVDHSYITQPHSDRVSSEENGAENREFANSKLTSNQEINKGTPWSGDGSSVDSTNSKFQVSDSTKLGFVKPASLVPTTVKSVSQNNAASVQRSRYEALGVFKTVCPHIRMWGKCRRKHPCRFRHNLPVAWPSAIKQMSSDPLMQLYNILKQYGGLFLLKRVFSTITKQLGALRDFNNLTSLVKDVLEIDMNSDRAPFISDIIKALCNTGFTFNSSVDIVFKSACVSRQLTELLSDILLNLIVETRSLDDKWSVIQMLISDRNYDIDNGIIQSILIQSLEKNVHQKELCLKVYNDLLMNLSDHKLSTVFESVLVDFKEMLKKLNLLKESSDLQLRHEKSRNAGLHEESRRVEVRQGALQGVNIRREKQLQVATTNRPLAISNIPPLNSSVTTATARTAGRFQQQQTQQQQQQDLKRPPSLLEHCVDPPLVPVAPSRSDSTLLQNSYTPLIFPPLSFSAASNNNPALLSDFPSQSGEIPHCSVVPLPNLSVPPPNYPKVQPTVSSQPTILNYVTNVPVTGRENSTFIIPKVQKGMQWYTQHQKLNTADADFDASFEGGSTFNHDRVKKAVYEENISDIMTFIMKFKDNHLTDDFLKAAIDAMRESDHNFPTFYGNMCKSVLVMAKGEEYKRDKHLEYVFKTIGVNLILHLAKNENWNQAYLVHKNLTTMYSDDIVNVKLYIPGRYSFIRRILVICHVYVKKCEFTIAWNMLKDNALNDEPYWQLDHHPSDVHYKNKILDEFLASVATKTNWNLGLNAVQYLIQNNINVADLKTYCDEIIKFAVTSDTEVDGILAFISSSPLWYNYVSRMAFRSVLVKIFLKGFHKFAVTLFVKGCSLNIYPYIMGDERVLKFSTHYTFEEIRLMLNVFFQNMAQHKPIDYSVVIKMSDASEELKSETPPFFYHQGHYTCETLRVRIVNILNNYTKPPIMVKCEDNVLIIDQQQLNKHLDERCSNHG